MEDFGYILLAVMYMRLKACRPGEDRVVPQHLAVLRYLVRKPTGVNTQRLAVCE